MAKQAARVVANKMRRGPRPRRKLMSAEDAALIRTIQEAWSQCQAAAKANDKVWLRALHLRAKAHDKITDFALLRRQFERLRRYFPNPTRIEPSQIRPRVVPVRPRTLEERLFKVTRGYWSMPYSKGYGRRLRFLVMDDAHDAVIGVIGLQSPSADLACRDDYLDVPRNNKLAVVNQTLDAYTVGATPAYAPILGGKLVAGYLCSPVIRQEFWRTYVHKPTTQLQRRSDLPLLGITTASAFGRSSIYNRLRHDEHLLARSLGYTRGYGTIHLEEIYPQLVEWLRRRKKLVPGGFGNGPKVRWQNITNALVGLRASTKWLEHGLQREVFIVELVNNFLDVCRDGATPDPIVFDDAQWGNYWLERWALPRVTRNPEWHEIPASIYLRSALSVSAVPSD